MLKLKGMHAFHQFGFHMTTYNKIYAVLAHRCQAFHNI